MQTPVILGALRTALGSFQGGLKGVPAPRLAGTVAAELLRRLNVPPADVDELILGNVIGAGLGQNPARQAAVLAGIPFSSSAFTVDMVCGSGLRAVCLAAQAVALGESAVVIAGGAENMSRAPQLVLRDAAARRPLSAMRHDGLHCAFKRSRWARLAESLARRHEVSREEQDATRSRERRAAESIAARFSPPRSSGVPRRRGSGLSATSAPATTARWALALLKPAFRKDGHRHRGECHPDIGRGRRARGLRGIRACASDRPARPHPGLVHRRGGARGGVRGPGAPPCGNSSQRAGSRSKR